MNASQCSSRISNGKSGGKQPSPDSYRDDRKQAALRPAAPAVGYAERLDKPAWMSLDAWRGYLEINHY